MPEVKEWETGSRGDLAEIKSLLENILGLLSDMRNAEASGDGKSGEVTGDIIIPVYIGTTLIDEIVLSAQKRADLRSGGR